MVAGPSEVVVVADATADADWVAGDMLAQAEHDPMARALLITDASELIPRVAAALERQLAALPRRAIAAQSLQANGALIRVANLDDAVALANRLAPEHLELLVAVPAALLPRVRHAGAVFLGAPHPGGRGRLRRRPEPRAADRRHGAVRVAAVDRGLREAVERHRVLARRIARCRAASQDPDARRGPGRARERRRLATGRRRRKEPHEPRHDRPAGARRAQDEGNRDHAAARTSTAPAPRRCRRRSRSSATCWRRGRSTA